VRVRPALLTLFFFGPTGLRTNSSNFLVGAGLSGPLVLRSLVRADPRRPHAALHSLDLSHDTKNSRLHTPVETARRLRRAEPGPQRAANREMPYGYRVDASGGDYALVATGTRNSKGNLEDVMPLLDRNVTIPSGTRRVADHANLMADDLSRQTGLHIGCCQWYVAGIPWGIAEVTFQASSKPVRQVLKSLILMEQRAEWSSERTPKHPIPTTPVTSIGSLPVTEPRPRGASLRSKVRTLRGVHSA
jgi:hypothetical protein